MMQPGAPFVTFSLDVIWTLLIAAGSTAAVAALAWWVGKHVL